MAITKEDCWTYISLSHRLILNLMLFSRSLHLFVDSKFYNHLAGELNNC